MSKIYVGTSLHNADRAKHIIKRFLDKGISISYDWTRHGQVYNDDELAKYGLLEEQGVRSCDVFFMIQPARIGTGIEFGMAYILGKPIIILEDVEAEKKTFYYRPNVFRFKSEDDAISFALSKLEGTDS